MSEPSRSVCRSSGVAGEPPGRDGGVLCQVQKFVSLDDVFAFGSSRNSRVYLKFKEVLLVLILVLSPCTRSGVFVWMQLETVIPWIFRHPSELYFLL